MFYGTISIPTAQLGWVTIHLGSVVSSSTARPQKSRGLTSAGDSFKSSGKFPLNKTEEEEPRPNRKLWERGSNNNIKTWYTVLGYNNYTSPSVGCLVYLHNVVSIVLSLCMMFCFFAQYCLTVAKAVILRWAGVFLPGGQMQMPLIIRDDLDDGNEEIENSCRCTHCKYSHVLMTIQWLCVTTWCFYILYFMFL